MRFRGNQGEEGIRLCRLNVEKLGSSAEVAGRILEHAGILVNEGTPYGEHGEGYLRIVTGCFADDERARGALERIRAERCVGSFIHPSFF